LLWGFIALNIKRICIEKMAKKDCIKKTCKNNKWFNERIKECCLDESKRNECAVNNWKNFEYISLKGRLNEKM
jgi:hypothetical protein